MKKLIILIGVVCLWAAPSLAKEDKTFGVEEGDTND